MTAAIPASAAHPNLSRGLEPSKLYEYNDFDSVNLYNGNLNVAIPLGQEFKGNGTLSYRFHLVYNSKVWDFERHWALEMGVWKAYNKAVPSKKSNAGMGWSLSLGRLIAPQDPVNTPTPDEGAPWMFVASDGAEHVFSGEYTTDGSYLKMTAPSVNERVIYFPDGSYYLFIQSGNRYFLRFIFDPHGNRLEVTYRDASGNLLAASSWDSAMLWRLTETDALGGVVRTHHVRFQTRYPLNAPANYVRQVSSVELAGFNGTVSTYRLIHTDRLTKYGCYGDYKGTTLTPDPTVPMLDTVYLPDNSVLSAQSSWGFTYNSTSCIGALSSMRLPTLGTVQYTYGTYSIPTNQCPYQEYEGSNPRNVVDSSIGVSSRAIFDASGVQKAGWNYSQTIGDSAYSHLCADGWMWLLVQGESKVRVDHNPGGPASAPTTRTEHYFSVWPDDVTPQGGYGGKDFGMPYTRRDCPAGSGLCLSSQTYECSGGSCANLRRESFVQYEADNQWNWPNRRVARSRTIFHDDSQKFVETRRSGYDGHGNYRFEQTLDGTGRATASGSLLRTQFTNYNPDEGTTNVDPVTWAASSTATVKPSWILGTFRDSYRQASGGFATEYAQYCFDLKGRLTRQRTMVSASPGSTDQLTVHTYDSLGNRIRDEQFGGNLNSVGLSDVCSAAVSHNNHTYRIDHTWTAGSLATSRSMYGSSVSGFSHYEVDREIDQTTGLTKADSVSRSFGGSDGIRTAYEYDGLGRLTWTKPTPDPEPSTRNDAWTQNVYTRATSASSPASVQILHYANPGTGSPIAQAKYDFDAFGRVLREGMLGANGAWMYRETQRNGAGWPLSVSEWDAVLSPYWRTSYSYDWSGRLKRIEPPVGQATDILYFGARRKDTTQRLATDASGNETAATTSEESDMLGRLTAVVEPNGIRTTYAYDAGDRLRYVCSNQSAGCVQQRWFTYDGRGLLTAEYHPERYATTYSAFDARGNATTVSISSGFSHNYTFDRAGRLTLLMSGGRPLKEFIYATGNSGNDQRNGKVLNAKRWNWHDRFGIYGLVTETYNYEGRGGRPSKRSTAVETFDFYHVLQGSKKFDQTWSWHHLGGPLVTGYPVCGGLSPCNVAGARNLTHDYTNGWLTNVREGSSSWGSIAYHNNGMVASVTHTNQMQSVYGKDPRQMQRPASISASYGGTSYWGTGAYGYDSAGNVRAMGNDYYVYDVLGRLTQGTSERVSPSTYKQQNQTYDLYGNITNFQTIVNGSVTNRPVYVSSSTNRLLYSNYDGNGNLTFDGTETYGWDPMNMMISRQSGSRDILYLYTADDERIWTYDLIANRADYAIRDLDKKVLRIFDENWGSWSWKKDFLHRGTTLLGSSSPAGAYHYTVDHLGTPRYITNAWRQQIGRHAYYPFGEESTAEWQNQESMKFTGHERDTSFGGSLDYLDYMHARSYRPVQGRFLSVDPTWESADAGRPQSWNRYSYVTNNPIVLTDPDGRKAIIRRDRNNIYIEIPVRFSRDATPERIARFTAAIESQWSGTFGQYNVTTRVTRGGFLANRVRFDAAPGETNRSSVTGGRSATIYTYGDATVQSAVDAHEAGHLMNHRDKYTDQPDGTSRPNPGWESNIMATVPGRTEEKNVDEILQKNRIRQLTTVNSGD